MTWTSSKSWQWWKSSESLWSWWSASSLNWSWGYGSFPNRSLCSSPCCWQREERTASKIGLWTSTCSHWELACWRSCLVGGSRRYRSVFRGLLFEAGRVLLGLQASRSLKILTKIVLPYWTFSNSGKMLTCGWRNSWRSPISESLCYGLGILWNWSTSIRCRLWYLKHLIVFFRQRWYLPR